MEQEINYDAIVIGSGLGGLTAGALFAKRGKRVLVLERHSALGGAATIFKRRDLVVEVGLHETAGLGEGGLLADLYRTLGLDRRLRMVSTDGFFRVDHAALGEPFVMPDGAAAARDAVKRRFPVHAEGIDRYFDTLARIRDVLTRLDHLSRSALRAALRFYEFPGLLWPLIRYEKQTLGGFLDELFGDDERIKLALCANVCYYADDPYALSLLFFAIAQEGYHRDGSRYIHGGSQSLSDQLAEIIREAGCDTLTRREATEIVVRGRRAVGVHHERAAVIGSDKPVKQRDRAVAWAPVIFGNAAPEVLAGMLPAAEAARFMAPYRERTPSTSLWSLYLGFDRPLAEFGVTDYSTFIYPDWFRVFGDMAEFPRLLGAAPNGRMPGFVLVDYSRIEAGLGDGPPYLAALLGVDRLANWEALDEALYRERKEAWCEALIGALEARFPGIGTAIVHREMATARTMKTYLNTPQGAVYGYAQEPAQAGRLRPPAKSPLAGLWVASAFGSPGGGFTGAMLAGASAARSAG